MQFRVPHEFDYATEIDFFCIEHGIEVPESYKEKFIGEMKFVDLGRGHFTNRFINNVEALIEFEKLLKSFL